MKIIHLSLGGPTYRISVRGKLIPFEMHPYCGPALERIPRGFWDAIELWQKGGSKLEGDICVVPSKCIGCNGTGYLLRHLGGRSCEVVGKCEACGGNGFTWAKDGEQ